VDDHDVSYIFIFHNDIVSKRVRTFLESGLFYKALNISDYVASNGRSLRVWHCRCLNTFSMVLFISHPYMFPSFDHSHAGKHNTE
jgi:hypothetical protein